MNNGIENAIEFFAFSPLLPDEDSRQGGCSSCLSIIIGIIFVICLFQSCFASFGSSLLTSYESVYEAYKNGEPDYADGDLEDKLGDSGYYYDLFPEERDGEPKDYAKGKNSKSPSSPKNYNSNFEITDDFIRNMNNYDTRKFRFEFPDGSSWYGTMTDFEKIKAQLRYGFTKIGDKWYYKKQDGSFKTGWQQDSNGKWFYFDPVDLSSIENQLKEIDGKVYYFNENGEMEANKIVNIAGYKINIDKDGICVLINN